MYMKKISSSQVLILSILFILLLLMILVMSIEAIYSKVYLSETISTVGNFVKVFISFFKKI